MSKITVDQFSIGVIGMSVLRNWYRDGAFNEARMSEVREVIARRDEFPWSLELDPQEQGLVEGYAEWAEVYDGPNPLVEAEQHVVHPVLRRLAQAGTRALDAACGTGRQAAFLASVGCAAVGVDQSEAMLEVARTKLPDHRFEFGTLEHLPFDDDEFDLAIVSLALCHLADPTSAVAELARVVRPAGTLVVTDPHPAGEIVGSQAFYGGIVDGQPMHWVRNHYHSASTWLRAFRAAGVTVQDCVEAPFSEEQIAAFPTTILHPEAARAALDGLPSLWMWELRV